MALSIYKRLSDFFIEADDSASLGVGTRVSGKSTPTRLDVRLKDKLRFTAEEGMSSFNPTAIVADAATNLMASGSGQTAPILTLADKITTATHSGFSKEQPCLLVGDFSLSRASVGVGDYEIFNPQITVQDKATGGVKSGSGKANPVFTLQEKATLPITTAGHFRMVAITDKATLTPAQANSQFGDGLPSGLIHQIESLDFNAISDGTNVTSWNDKSGQGNNWAVAAVAPKVDQVVKCNGNATVKFASGAGSGMVIASSFFPSSGFAGLEAFCVYKHLSDPVLDPPNAGPAFMFNQNGNPVSHQPFNDRVFKENFGVATRLDLGTTMNNVGSDFFCYNIAVKADGTALDAWLNSENFAHLTGGYTFNQKGVNDQTGGAAQGYHLGWGKFVGFQDYFFGGNIAALYVFNRRLSDSERTFMRNFITTRWGVLFQSNAFASQFPTGLIHAIESSDFDGTSGGTSVATWLDKSGLGNLWKNTTNAPVVDQTIKCNGHATIKFAGSSQQGMKNNSFFSTSGFAGLEIFCIYRHSEDPPNDPPNSGPAFMFNHQDNAVSHQPFHDRHVYENFAETVRRDLGIPTTNTASAFRCYNIAAASDGSAYDAWMDMENFFHATSGYTFNQKGVNDQLGGPAAGYFIGTGLYVTFQSYFFGGNIAAIYVFNRRLSSAERTSVRGLLATRWGVSVS